MAHIKAAGKQKKLIRLCVWLLRKKLGECGTAKAIHDDIINCGNPALAFINNLIIESTDKIKCDWQKNTINELSEIGIWIGAYKDTAYRDWFFYMLDDFLKQENVEKLRELIKPYVKEPKDWHVNLWIDSKEMTKQKREKGELLKNQKSEAESMFTAPLLKKKLSKFSDDDIIR